MTSNKKLVNYKVVDHIENYNFSIDYVNIWDFEVIWQIKKKLKSGNLKRIFEPLKYIK